MDARSFANYFKNILLNESKKYEGALLSVSYDNIADAKRTSGIRDTFVGVANSIDSAVTDFYDKSGNKLPDPSPVNKEI